ncbi:MAG: DUF3618 domain-containing protein [Acidipropionibacterium sp.]|jgi:hypothetical protein|nr:DUF3618 domain-containing protein [Acidipropionibacterium sp.]
MADSGQQSKAKDTRSVDEIRRDISITRTRTSATLEGLAESYHPAAIKNRVVEGAKTTAQEKFEEFRDKAYAQVKDEAGWRIDRLKQIGIVGAAGFTGLLVLRAVVGRLTGATARKKFRKAEIDAAKTAKKTAKKQAKAAKKQAKHASK